MSEGARRNGTPSSRRLPAGTEESRLGATPLIETRVMISSRGRYPTADHHFWQGRERRGDQQLRRRHIRKSFKSCCLADRWRNGKTDGDLDRSYFVRFLHDALRRRLRRLNERQGPEERRSFLGRLYRSSTAG